MPNEDPQLPVQLVDALNALSGVHRGYRAAHAKGIVCQGTFAATPEAAGISRAPHFAGASTPVTVRFSNSPGIPDIPDGIPDASPRGMATRFHTSAGEADIVAHSHNGFPAATAEEFLEFLRAAAASGPDAPKPTAIEKFLSTHPSALAFVQTPKAIPESYGTLAYFPLHAFRFINREGAGRFGRYRIVPVEGERHLDPAEAAARPANYLRDELAARLKQQPVEFRLLLQLAEDGDPTNNVTLAWPESRRLAELGTISIKSILADSDAAERRLIFDPVHLVDGIELSADPLPRARSAAYGVSYERRNA